MDEKLRLFIYFVLQRLPKKTYQFIAGLVYSGSRIVEKQPDKLCKACKNSLNKHVELRRKDFFTFFSFIFLMILPVRDCRKKYWNNRFLNFATTDKKRHGYRL
ncbi:MAG: hypothetical protein D3910_05400 [Candidatus Electrothrix sp. ATG2]|nr:hypothetical protein [Candidatus Electrothrix sp. ATG2]